MCLCFFFCCLMSLCKTVALLFLFIQSDQNKDRPASLERFISVLRKDIDSVRSTKQLWAYWEIVSKSPVISLYHVCEPLVCVILQHDEDSLCSLIVLLCLLSMQDKLFWTLIRRVHVERLAIQWLFESVLVYCEEGHTHTILLFDPRESVQQSIRGEW